MDFRYVHWYVAYVPWLFFAFTFWPQTWDIPYALYYFVAVTFTGQTMRLVVTGILCRLHGPVYPGVCERYSFQHYRIEAKQNPDTASDADPNPNSIVQP